MRALVQSALDLLFPPQCVGCGRAGALFCATCSDSIRAAQHTPSDFAPPLTDTRSYGEYRDKFRKAIHAFKYEGMTRLAPRFGTFLHDTLKTTDWSPTLILPVPLHPERLAERGFNQSALLAKELGRLAQITVGEEVLVRQRDTLPQVGLKAGERATNLEGAFTVHQPEMLRGASVIILDDVLTTGATLRGCTNVVRNAGAVQVYGLTLARAVGAGRYDTEGP